MSGYDDPLDPRNGAKYHTGKPCVEPGCEEPAGTAWSPHFCFKHNVERFNRIDKAFGEMEKNWNRVEKP
jgi:hypothetical protein